MIGTAKTVRRIYGLEMWQARSPVRSITTSCSAATRASNAMLVVRTLCCCCCVPKCANTTKKMHVLVRSPDTPPHEFNHHIRVMCAKLQQVQRVQHTITLTRVRLCVCNEARGTI